MQPTQHLKNRAWDEAITWLRIRAERGELQTAFELRTPTVRRYAAQQYALSRAKGLKAKVWRVWYDKDVMQGRALFEVLVVS